MQTVSRRELAIPVSGKIDLKTKIVTRDKQVHFKIIKGSIHQEDIIITNT